MTLPGVSDTGERADVWGKPRTHEEFDHLGRYSWAAGQLSGHVLDVACGTGYGSALLARRAVVSGLDADSAAIAAARERVPSAEFYCCSLPDIPLDDEALDAVVSFETVEHIDDDVAYIAELRRVLKRGGMLLLSTPNAAVTSPDGVVRNPWHVREYRIDELRALLNAFRDVEVFMQGAPPASGLRRTALRVVARFPVLCRPGRWWDRFAHGTGEVERWDGRTPVIWIIRARK